jgi:hypothetical protein
MAAGAKIVALAQAQRAEGVLVHGSVLEHRPPAYLVDAVEELLDEPWQGDGLAASGVAVARDKLWRSVLERLETALAGELSAGRPDTDSRSPEVAT